jgi:hypothetical protein
MLSPVVQKRDDAEAAAERSRFRLLGHAHDAESTGPPVHGSQSNESVESPGIAGVDAVAPPAVGNPNAIEQIRQANA